MPSTTFKGYTIPGFNTEVGTWGTDINSNYTSVVDLNVGGQVSIGLSSTTPLALTTGSTGQIQYSIISFTGSLLANIATNSANQGFNFVENRTTGSFSVTYQSNFGSGGVGTNWTIPQGFSALFFNDTTFGARTITWLPSLLLSQSGSQPITVRRTENTASAVFKAISIQSGSGSGNDYSISETGDGSGNVTTVTEKIGGTTIGTKTTSAQAFPIPISLAEIGTPSAPASGNLLLYAISGDLLATETPGGQQIVYGKAPTVQSFTTGSATYTPASGTIRIRVRMVGGGGGGGGNGGNGNTGGTTSFGSWTALGGNAGGIAGGYGGNGGANGTGTLIVRAAGNGGGSTSVGGGSSSSGAGGGSLLGGGAPSVIGNAGAGSNALANTGGGGSAQGSNSSTNGGGGGGGEYVEFYVSLPGATSYTVGGGGSGGTGGFPGGNGGSGIIIIEEYYN
jgi:hypothetical protein